MNIIYLGDIYNKEIMIKDIQRVRYFLSINGLN